MKVLLSGLQPPSQEELEALANSLDLGSFDLKRILSIVVLLVACLLAMRILMTLLGRTLRRLDVDKSLRVFIQAVLRVLLWLITICVVLDYIGVPMTSLVAVLGVMGLALTLAVQGTLSNLAGGIMILVSRPFKADDYIEAGSVSGLVVEVGLAYTKMRTYDNKLIHVPNGQIAAEKITNYSAEPERRVDLNFYLAYSTPSAPVIDCLRAVVDVHPKTLFTPEPFIGVNALKDNGVEYSVRAWCATPDYWDVYYELLAQCKQALEQAGLALTYPHMNVHIMEKETEGIDR